MSTIGAVLAKVATALKEFLVVGLKNKAVDMATDNTHKIIGLLLTGVALIMSIFFLLTTVIALPFVLIGVILNPLNWFGSNITNNSQHSGLVVQGSVNGLIPNNVSQMYVDVVKELNEKTGGQVNVDYLDMLSFDIVYFDGLNPNKDNFKKIKKKHIEELIEYFYDEEIITIEVDQTDNVKKSQTSKFDYCVPMNQKPRSYSIDEYQIQPMYELDFDDTEESNPSNKQGQIWVKYVDSNNVMLRGTDIISVNVGESYTPQPFNITDYRVTNYEVSKPYKISYANQRINVTFTYDEDGKYYCHNYEDVTIYHTYTLQQVKNELKSAYKLDTDKMNLVDEQRAILEFVLSVDLSNSGIGGGNIGDVEFGTGEFIPPVSNTSSWYVTSEFGYRPNVIPHQHAGIDIGSKDAVTPILAIADGKVRIAKLDTSGSYGGGFGYYVVITHETLTGQIESVYAHMLSNLQVMQGQNVAKGDVIGYMGATGNVTGRHLHFEIAVPRHTGGSPYAVNPRQFIDFTK